jgi:hypothetical protein
MTTEKKQNGKGSRMTPKQIDGATVALGVGVGLALVSAVGGPGALIAIALAAGFRSALRKQHKQDQGNSSQQ